MLEGLPSERRQPDREGVKPIELRPRTLSSRGGPSLADLKLSPLHQKLIFELDPELNPVIERYEPEFLSAGGEHLVYALPGRPHTVAKLHVDDLLYGCKKHGALRTAGRDLLSPVQRLAVESQRLAELARYFPREQLLKQRSFCMELEFGKLMLAMVTRNPDIGSALRFPVGVTFQEVAKILEHPQRCILTVGYAEHREPVTSSYAAVTERYVYGINTEYYHVMAMRDVQPMLWAAGVVQAIQQDRAFAATVRRFVDSAARYVNETGEGLDLFGYNNVAFAPSSGRWEVKLIDPLYPVPQVRDQAYGGLRALRAGISPSPRDRMGLLNFLNLTRSINFLAERSGAIERINPIPEELRVDTGTLLATLKP